MEFLLPVFIYVFKTFKAFNLGMDVEGKLYLLLVPGTLILI